MANLEMEEDITRGNIIDFRSTLLSKGLASATVNKIIGVLKIIFNEAFFREEINKNPVANIGIIKETHKEIGIFKLEELIKMFPENNLGPWKTKVAFFCFFTAAFTGMRRGEVLALRWKYIDFKRKSILIKEAWKNKNETGLPKWNHIREIPMPEFLGRKLEYFSTKSKTNDLNDLVFCNADGSRLGETWWKKNFDNALLKMKIDKKKRNLRPHSFRHSLNTILRDYGMPVDKLRSSFGWNSEQIHDNYTHFKLESLKQQADIIDSFWKNKKENT